MFKKSTEERISSEGLYLPFMQNDENEFVTVLHGKCNRFPLYVIELNVNSGFENG